MLQSDSQQPWAAKPNETLFFPTTAVRFSSQFGHRHPEGRKGECVLQPCVPTITGQKALNVPLEAIEELLRSKEHCVFPNSLSQQLGEENYLVHCFPPSVSGLHLSDRRGLQHLGHNHFTHPGLFCALSKQFQTISPRMLATVSPSVHLLPVLLRLSGHSGYESPPCADNSKAIQQSDQYGMGKMD